MPNKQLIINIILAAGIITALTFSLLPKDKTGYIRTADVFEVFNLKQELESKYMGVEQQRTNILDSLKLQLQGLYDQITNEKNKQTQESMIVSYQTLEQHYLLKEKQFTESNQKIQADYNSQIITQINQYVQDYGKQYGYKYIFGTTSNGNIMHASETEDLTEVMKKYVNERYEGK